MEPMKTVVTETDIFGFFEEYRFLSNIHECQVEVEGIIYTSSEAAYVAQKTLDQSIRLEISRMDPKKAKVFGQIISLRDNWTSYRVLAMVKVLLAKFNQNPELKQKLLDTGNKYLEETNTWNDTFWGVCDGKGYNMLGECLMAVRESFKC